MASRGAAAVRAGLAERAAPRARSAPRGTSRRRSPAGDRAAGAGGRARARARATRGRARARPARTARRRARRRRARSGSSAHENVPVPATSPPGASSRSARVERPLDRPRTERGGCEHEHADAVAEPERLQPARQLVAGQLAARPSRRARRRPAAARCRRPRAGAAARARPRHRLVQRQPVELAQPAGVLGGHEPCLRGRAGVAVCRARRRAATGQRQRAAGGPLEPPGRVAAPRAARARSRSSAATRGDRAASSARRTRAARAPRRGRRTPSPCRRSATASAAATPSSPRSESTIRSSRSWAESARCSTAYCSLTRCVNAFSVTAMNGTS